MRIAAILPAAGLGSRFASAAPRHLVSGPSKIEMDLLGRPVFLRALELFTGHPRIVQIILAVNPDTLEEFKYRWGEKLAFMGVTLVAGGRRERWETVKLALEAVHASTTHVAVHDAARPLTDPQVIERVFQAADRYPAVIPGILAAATLKRIQPLESPGQTDLLGELLGDRNGSCPPLGKVAGGVDRRDVVEVQTPQVFEINLLRRAYARIEERPSHHADTPAITDDAMLVEALGESVVVVEGASTNFKITRPQDLELARAWLAMKQASGPAASARKRLVDEDDQ